MERNVGYAVITTEEYREMIEDNINKAECIRKSNEVAFKRNSINEKLEKYFFDGLLDNENYHLENMKECNPSDYHYQELYNRFLKIGIDDVQYIHLSIASLKHNFDVAENKKPEEKED